MICFSVEVKTTNDLNSRQHWRPVAKRAKAQRAASAAASMSAFAVQGRPELPCVVSMTRISRGELDDDAVPGSLKHIRDGIADVIGVDDRKREIVRYECHQERGKAPSVRVEIRPMEKQ